MLILMNVVHGEICQSKAIHYKWNWLRVGWEGFSREIILSLKHVRFETLSD